MYYCFLSTRVNNVIKLVKYIAHNYSFIQLLDAMLEYEDSNDFLPSFLPRILLGSEVLSVSAGSLKKK